MNDAPPIPPLALGPPKVSAAAALGMLFTCPTVGTDTVTPIPLHSGRLCKLEATHSYCPFNPLLPCARQGKEALKHPARNRAQRLAGRVLNGHLLAMEVQHGGQRLQALRVESVESVCKERLYAQLKGRKGCRAG
jgi:hypothetical protein